MSLRGASGDEAIYAVVLKTFNCKGMRLPLGRELKAERLRFARNDFFSLGLFIKKTCETAH